MVAYKKSSNRSYTTYIKHHRSDLDRDREIADIVDEPTQAALLLGSSAAEFYLEITINNPRTKQFNKFNSHQQRVLLWKQLHKMCHSFGDVDFLEITDSACEASADGNLHLHGLLHSTSKYVHFPLTVIADVVKGFLTTLPKKYDIYRSENMYPKWRRYKGASVCVQYRDAITDIDRIDEFRKYIRKYT